MANEIYQRIFFEATCALAPMDLPKLCIEIPRMYSQDVDAQEEIVLFLSWVGRDPVRAAKWREVNETRASDLHVKKKT